MHVPDNTKSFYCDSTDAWISDAYNLLAKPEGCDLDDHIQHKLDWRDSTVDWEEAECQNTEHTLELQERYIFTGEIHL
jgi:hypothetical protein